ncbi:MAG: DUF218 domain-containing protein [Fibrobacter sp.]|jgi:uncharacterized SAM-binding protein YcdF (DUF218 family)|nr:DUF218 domain-containing protein [Fibrobacter sp.]
MNKLKFTNPFTIILAFSTLFIVLCLFMLLNMGRWLVIYDPIPENLDLIVTFAGEQRRVAYSRELAMKFPQSSWILSDYKNGYSRLLRKSNFNMSRVHIVDTCQNTVSEIDAVAKWIKNNQQKFSEKSRISIGLVSSPYHMRRIQLIVKKQFKNSDFSFHYLPVPLERYKWTNKMLKYWWRTGAVSRVVISEFQKIIYFLLIY